LIDFKTAKSPIWHSGTPLLPNLEWLHLPASYHDGAAGISFADGHAAVHPWNQGSTKPPNYPDAADLPIDLNKSQAADFEWLAERTSVEQ
jgi:prepilin-type processing-associated H-X9-DG protein